MKLPWKKKRPAAQPSNLDTVEQQLAAMLMSSAAASGVHVTPLKALGVATVFSCVNVISRTISTLPIKLYERTADGRREAREHPLFDLLHASPNEEMTSTDFRGAVQSNLTLRNNAFIQVRRNGLGNPVDLRPVSNGDIELKREGSQLAYYVDGRRARRGEIIHLRGLTTNGIQGLDPTNTCADVIGLAISLDTNAAKFFANSSRPGLILEAPGTMSPEEYDRLKSNMDENYSTVEQAYRTLILEGGLKAANQRSDNDKSQFDQSRERQDKQIARIYGVPPHKVGIMGDATFSNIEQQNIEFVVDVIRPIATTWEQSLNKGLLTSAEREKYYIEINLDGLLRGDIATRYEAYNKAFQNGWLNANEIREMENRDPINGGDQYFRPLNLAHLDAPMENPANPTA